MIILAVDTSTRWAGVGLQVESGERTEMTWRSEQNHGRELMPAISDVTERASVGVQDVTHLTVALGPGGFSAVRVGISTVLGLALPKGLPVVGIPTHEIEAHPFREYAATSSPLISLLPAGRSELSWCRFETVAAEPETGLGTPDEIVAAITASTRLCGEGAELLDGLVEKEQILSGESPTRSPVHMLEIAAQRLSAGEATPLTELRPIYARPPSITMRNPGT